MWVRLPPRAPFSRHAVRFTPGFRLLAQAPAKHLKFDSHSTHHSFRLKLDERQVDRLPCSSPRESTRGCQFQARGKFAPIVPIASGPKARNAFRCSESFGGQAELKRWPLARRRRAAPPQMRHETDAQIRLKCLLS